MKAISREAAKFYNSCVKNPNENESVSCLAGHLPGVSDYDALVVVPIKI